MNRRQLFQLLGVRFARPPLKSWSGGRFEMCPIPITLKTLQHATYRASQMVENRGGPVYVTYLIVG